MIQHFSFIFFILQRNFFPLWLRHQTSATKLRLLQATKVTLPTIICDILNYSQNFVIEIKEISWSSPDPIFFKIKYSNPYPKNRTYLLQDIQSWFGPCLPLVLSVLVCFAFSRKQLIDRILGLNRICHGFLNCPFNGFAWDFEMKVVGFYLDQWYNNTDIML